MDPRNADVDAVIHGNDAAIYRLLFLSYPDALIVTDTKGRIVLANAGASSLFGYSHDELLQLNVDALVPDGTRPKHAAYREDFARAPRARPMGTQMNLVGRRRDGSEVTVEIALSPLQGHGLPLVVAAIRDIGAYPRVNQALRRARYSEHLAQYGRLAVDARGTDLLLSEVPALALRALEADMATVFLLDASRLQFRLSAHAGPRGDDMDAAIANRIDTLPGYVVSTGVPVVTSVDEEMHHEFSPRDGADPYRSGLMVPLFDRRETIGVVSVHSLAEDRFGRDEVRFLESLANLLSTGLQRAQTEEALGHAQRLEAVGQLTGGIAHDFNNLLTIIHGNLQVLEEIPAIVADPLAPQLVGAATRAARRGAELTAQLLAFSRRQRLHPTVVDPRGMLRSMSAMLVRALDQRIRIEVFVDEACPSVIADAGQLESALLNIAINARDAMPDGGTLTFRAHPVAALPLRIAEQAAPVDGDAAPAADGYVEVSVTDTGSGMPDRIRERAFEPFFTTKEPGRGTGLGLSTVYGFARQSRGAVELHTTLGRGTRIALFLPASPFAGALVDLPVDVHVPPAGLRVLLVEDDAEVRAVAVRFLEAMRCDVAIATSGEEALRQLETVDPPELLLTDIALGAGMRGTRLAELATGLHPALRVLLVSGYSSELLDADQSVPATWELLQKPYTRQELAASIGRATLAE